MANSQEVLQQILDYADIKINGDRPWDIRVYDDKFYDRVFQDGALGFGEAYMENYWSADSVDELVYRLLSSHIEERLTSSDKIKIGFKVGASKVKRIFNRQTVKDVARDVPFHYDLGNDLFSKMLDSRMAYTCGYWKDATNLEEAQEAKLDLICRKIGLKPGMHVLDIGCGWGSFMNYAAEKYGAICDGITLSKEQAKLGQEIANAKNLPVTFIIEDYRKYQPENKYDAIVSVGMIEHVGPQNYLDYFKCANSFLKDNGIFLLHTIGNTESVTSTNPWIDKYIFPNGVIPSMTQLAGAMENIFNIEDVHNIGPDYDKTLMAWYANFEKAWPELKNKYGDKFYLMWKFYLLSCAAGFRAREINVWQFGLTKIGTKHPDQVRAI